MKYDPPIKKDPIDQRFAGMTVNERIYLAGLMEDFDRAVERRDKEALRAVLERVELDPALADHLIK